MYKVLAELRPREMKPGPAPGFVVSAAVDWESPVGGSKPEIPGGPVWRGASLYGSAGPDRHQTPTSFAPEQSGMKLSLYDAEGRLSGRGFDSRHLHHYGDARFRRDEIPRLTAGQATALSRAKPDLPMTASTRSGLRPDLRGLGAL
jgi:hypothetical protein